MAGDQLSLSRLEEIDRQIQGIMAPRIPFFFISPRFWLMEDNIIKEEMRKMVRDNFSHTYYFRRCKKIKWSAAESIPNELLFEILLRIPAQDIYFGSRLVCQTWYHMVRTKKFIHKHLEHASYGLLYRDKSEDIVFISSREDGGGIDTYKLHYNNKKIVWSSCNGLMLKYDVKISTLIYYVVNVSTGQAFELPPLPFNIFSSVANSAIGYDATSMTYKVVVRHEASVNWGYCVILTVGVDKLWRRVRTNHISSLDEKTIIMGQPIITEGFVHWKDLGTHVVTLNLATEIITENPPPIPKVSPFNKNIACSCCLSTGRYLSLFLQRGKYVWEFYEMKSETGEWRKLSNICLEGKKRGIEMFGFEHNVVNIKPCGWLKYPEVLALRIQHWFIISYNLITCEIGSEMLSISQSFFPVTLHKNSLVCF